jgi:hypothetical protein
MDLQETWCVDWIQLALVRVQQQAFEHSDEPFSFAKAREFLLVSQYH